ncbi:Hypothetical protein R9X50_00731900 [Acrodontium crateriforme]|uniref:NEDD8-activating enzyme E1 regulatory subunit n=1 Tax=Acrodontium crateriforme TaxID=150365 RepID=A0AAQ3MBL9_9PEZI|nr:Hypothetical protein R9X50_00731900 [Acrodontium crateriforme]
MEVQVPPPLQDIPTAKEKKYDRQLRLWGASGQKALEETHVLLINNGSGVTGVETLKNLVLPGVGQFTILDSHVVSEADLGVNFFLEEESLGQFRAEETVRCLCELNPGVQGFALTEPLETFIDKDDVLKPYNLILVSAPLDSAILARIQLYANALQIPTFYFRSTGFYSSFSVLLPTAFPIVDTHPDPTSTTDLRLLKPWPTLSEFVREKTKGLGTESMNQHDKSHIPYVCLLLHYLEQWRDKNGGKNPETYKEKSAFRELVREGDANEENFDEACANVLKALNPPTISSTVRNIFAAPEIDELTTSSPSFWLIANAIRQFYNTHNELPLPGAVPDMKAQSADYIELQNIYKKKARQDCAEVVETVRQLEKQTDRPKEHEISEKEIENFCKGAAHISLVRGRPLQIVEAGKPITFGDRAKAMAMELTNPESLIGLYICFLAWDEYIATRSTPSNENGDNGLKIPGSTDKDYKTDETKLIDMAHIIVDNLLKEANTSIDEPESSEIKAQIAKQCKELVRAGGGELHNLASLTGGMISQEVIKVVTRQYVPVDNTCLFDGIASRTYVLRI